MVCRSDKLKIEALCQIKIRKSIKLLIVYHTNILPCQNTELQSYFSTKLHCATRAGFLGLYTAMYQSISSRRSLG